MEATPTEDQQTPIKAENTPKVYTSISELPFSVYINAYLGDRSLISNWREIQEEFAESIGEINNISISPIAEVEALNKTYDLVRLFVAILMIEDNPIIREQLAILDFPVIDDDLEAVLARAESIKMEIDEKMDLINSQSPKNAEGLSRQMFTDIVARISRHYKLPLRIKDLMTDEFCSHYKAFQEEVSRSTPMAHVEEI